MSKDAAIPTQETALIRNPLDRMGSFGLMALYVTFVAAFVGGLYLLVERHEKAELQESMVSTATLISQNLTNFRSYYSSEIVSRLRNTDVPITHLHKQTPGSVPLPATMSIELGEFLNRQGEGLRYKIFSQYPFPWRQDRKLDDIERRVLDQVSGKKNSTFVQFEDIDGKPYLRYASRVRMTESCVKCHNKRADSPFRDWKVGDVRGVQQILLPMNMSVVAVNRAKSSFRHIMIFVTFFFAWAFVVALLLLRRNRLAFEGLGKMAESERQRRQDLEVSRGQLQEGLGRLHAVLDNVADAIVTIDEKGWIESANPATERIFGYRREELVGQNVSMLMPAAVADHHDGYLRKYRETGVSGIIGVGRELEGKRADGSIFPMELAIGELILEDRRLFTGIIRDIGSRKRAEADLKESEERTRTLSLVADRTDNAVVITDRQGLIEWTNDGFERVTGFTSEEVVGQRPGDFLQGTESDPDVVELMQKKIAAGEGFNVELINYSKSGRPYWVQIDAQPIIDDAGDIQHFIAIERDVTEAKEREGELEIARQKAEDGSRTKSRFLAMMSHEIRTPLNGILGAMGLIGDGQLDPEQKRFMEIAKKSSENLLAIINDILDVSKFESGRLDLELAATKLDTIAVDVVDVLMPKAREKGLEIILSVPPGLPEVLADAARLHQILLNFLSNAIKFTDRGQIDVRVRLISEESNRAIVAFEVEDTGRGISEQNQIHLFDEFWRASNPQSEVVEGTGLGLSICHRLAEMMGGNIEVSSTVGVGSIFTFKAPLDCLPDKPAPDPINDDWKVSPDMTAALQFDARVLVAEDSSANQAIIRAMLQRMGITVDAVANGHEAVAAAGANAYDVILMDINMPGLNGIKAASLIRDLDDPYGQTPIVAMTAYAMSGDREKILSQGLDDYISKPIRRPDLQNLLQRWLT